MDGRSLDRDARARARRRRDALRLAALLATTGFTHFAAPRPFDAMIPRALPGPARAWTYASGVAELAVAGALIVPKTRRIGGLAAAALFVGVFPGNVKMARDFRNRSAPLRVAAYARLPLQVPLVLWGLRVARDAPCWPARFADRTASRATTSLARCSPTYAWLPAHIRSLARASTG